MSALTLLCVPLAFLPPPPTLPQWFGNLVTMSWWTDLWLNEGFATWAGWRAVASQFPEWRVWDQFLANEQARGLELDALASSHPVEVEVRDASRVNEIFDAISYAKGASAIHMLVAHLGEATFQRGMRAYVSAHAYGNATTDDLWRALGDASAQPVRAYMTGWTRQTGFPYVSAARAAPGGPAALALTQRRFIATGACAAGAAEAGGGPLWHVPLRLVGAGAPTPSVDVLSARRGSCAVPAAAAAAAGGWLKLNAGQTGFFRVAYSAELWAPLAAAAPGLAPADRAGLVGDAFALAAAGAAPTAAALALLRSLGAAGEADYTVWAASACRRPRGGGPVCTIAAPSLSL